MLIKIIQIILFQGLFLLIYDLWLRKETFYATNRVYLLGTSILALILPFISFEVVSESIVGAQIVALSEVIINPQNIQLPEVILNSGSSISEYWYVFWIYSIGILIAFLFFLVKLTKLIRLIYTNNKQNKKGFILVELANTTNVFSFLNYLFIGDQVKNTDNTYLLAHEEVHIRHKHSLDLLWFEILKIILWFNPFVYLYQKRIATLHEFIADAESIKLSDSKTYYNHLLNDIFQVENMAFVNQFYNKSLINKRITMITKTQSKQWKQVKYLVLIPLTALMLFMTTNIVSQEDKTSIRTNSIEQVIAKDTIPERKEKWKQLMLFQERTKDKEILSREEYLEFRMLFNKVIPDSIASNINEKTYEEYVAFKKSPKSVAKRKEMKGAVPFSTIDEVPIYPGCENIQDKAEQRKCLSEKLQKQVATNFNVNLANSLGLSPGKKRIFVMFKIDKEGNITSIQARAPHKDLETEAIRVIETLPQMIPGKQEGKVVEVKYSLPITFVVQGKTKKKE